MYKYQPKASVYCSGCKELHNVNDVEFLDISEGMQGEDRMTFTCPHDNETHTGTVYG